MNIKTKLIGATALVVAVAAGLGFQAGRASRPPLRLTITVSGDIVDRGGDGIRNGVTATIDDVELLRLGPIASQAKP
jgi:hypothetical protein